MVTLSGELFLLVDDAGAFVTSLGTAPGAMEALRTGIAAPFPGLTYDMVTIQGFNSTRRLEETRFLAGSVTILYHIQYPDGIDLTSQFFCAGFTPDDGSYQ
jgi:hypothetical protein